jgi:hypothetical protein
MYLVNWVISLKDTAVGWIEDLIVIICPCGVAICSLFRGQVGDNKVMSRFDRVHWFV